jgi:4-hydroxy-3-polyprenylbenzoate decarboxylase
MKKIIVGLSGSSAPIYGIKVLELLQQQQDVEIHLILSIGAIQNIAIETDFKIEEVKKMAHFVWNNNDFTAPIASGSFKTVGMLIVPCSIKTLSAVAHSYNDSLLVRAADVCLKEKRKILLAVRETPLHEGHLNMMAQVSRLGALIFPPVPAFYQKPKSIDDMVTQTAARMLDYFDLGEGILRRWNGVE